MKKIIYTIALLIINLTFSQDIVKGNVIYNASIDFETANYDLIIKNKKISDKARKRVISTIKKSKDVKYNLSFDDNESIFIKEKILKNDGENNYRLTEIIGGKGIYYTNIHSKEILQQKEAFGETFLISISPVKWEFTGETKKIGEYTCNKAISTIKVQNSSGTTNKKIIAWYAKKINSSFGPKKYNGLPGLILELHEGKVTFTAINITLDSKMYLKIDKPIKGKKISQEKYNDIVKNLLEERRNGFK